MARGVKKVAARRKRKPKWTLSTSIYAVLKQVRLGYRSFSSFVHVAVLNVLRFQVHPDTGISRKAMSIMNDYNFDILERVCRFLQCRFFGCRC